jgi:hypothetical protein
MKIDAKEVSYTDLLLDPQNPRLATCFSENDGFDSSDPVACQQAIEERFRVPPHSDVQRETAKLISADEERDDEESEDDFFSVMDLKKSMSRIGFVGIQNIIVREHPDSGKFIVLEGNRRVAAIRSVIREHEAAIVGGQGHISDNSILDSLKTIQVMVFETEGRSEDVIRDEISTMLGLRHYGSQLKWTLLPRAKNICDEYTRLLNGADFSWASGKGNAVAATLAIKPAEVKKLLKGYLCYQQLSAEFDVKPHHFSLILAGAETPGLQIKGHEYFEIDKKTFELGDDTPEKFELLCQFGDRDTKGFEKTIKDPKQIKKLGQIMKDSVTASEQAVRGMATAFFTEVEEREVSLDDAYTQLLAFKKRQKWVPELRKLLDKQDMDEEKDGDLAINKYIGQGQQRKFLESLVQLIKRFKLLISSEPDE